MERGKGGVLLMKISRVCYSLAKERFLTVYYLQTIKEIMPRRYCGIILYLHLY